MKPRVAFSAAIARAEGLLALYDTMTKPPHTMKHDDVEEILRAALVASERVLAFVEK